MAQGSHFWILGPNAEAKGNGFDVKALRAIVRLRKQDKDERAEQETILQTYMLALGMI